MTVKKLTIGCEQDLWFFEWFGIEAWNKVKPTLIDPENPSTVRTLNPTSHTLSAFINLGVDPVLQRNLEITFREPAANPAAKTYESQLSPGEMLERFMVNMPLRREYVRTRVRWAPNEVIELPSAWWDSLRTVVRGVVIAGLVPQLVLENEVDPPRLHHTIAAANPPEVLGRRRK